MQYEDWGVRSDRWVGIRSETMQLGGHRVQLLRADAAPTAPPGAPPQLLLHGLAAGGVFVLDLIGPLTAFGPVVVPDLPGSIFGHTATPNRRAGDQDPLVERPTIDAVLARRPDWDLHVFEGAGHAAPVERPDEYATAVRRWLP